MPITIGPFTNVPAPGDPITSPWPQQITNYVVTTNTRVVQPTVFHRIVPTGVVDSKSTNSSVWATWYTVGALTVPAWATFADVWLTMSNVYEVTAYGNTIYTRLKIGSSFGNSVMVPNTTGAGIHVLHSYVDRLSVAPGSQTVTIEDLRYAGTGFARVDTISSINLMYQFQ